MSLPQGYLLDTNSISESRRKQRDVGFDAFFLPLDPSKMYMSVLTLGELRKGVAHRHRKDAVAAAALEAWTNEVEKQFEGRILGVDLPIARLWGELSGANRSRPAIDTLIAATAILNNLTVVTRNVIDFHDLPVRWVNPWQP